MTETTWPTDQNQRESEQRQQGNAVQRQPAAPGDLNPSQPAPDVKATNPPDKNPNKVDHAQLRPASDNKEGGKEMGLIHAPVVSMHPTSGSQTEEDKPEVRMIDVGNFKLNHYMHQTAHTEFKYPFEDMDYGQGMFIPVAKGKTTDSLMNEVFKAVDQYRKQNSEVERDENGDDVMEDVAINVKKRNEDGTVQLDGGVPRLTVRSGFRPKLIGPNFVVKAVVKGDKLGEDDSEEADTDGVLVVRMG
jgi:hypothetical protein